MKTSRQICLVGFILTLNFAQSMASFAEDLWHKEFPVFPKSTEVGSECLLAGPGKGINFNLYACPEPSAKVREFYTKKYHPSDKAGDFRSIDNSKILSIDEPNGKNQPSCKNKKALPAGTKSIVIVSSKIGQTPAQK